MKKKIKTLHPSTGQIVDRKGRLASSLVPPSAESGSSTAAPGVIQPRNQLPSQQNAIAEEEEEEGEHEESRPTSASPSKVSETAVVQTGGSCEGPYRWAVDLAETEPYWRGWFEHLSASFLAVPTAKLLLLAGVDRLDRDLTVGQMQVG
jgi:protein phosphatase methylesterase 1